MLNRSFGRAALCTLVLGLQSAAVMAADSDQDGVEDDVDVCCHTPAGVGVDDEGRPIGDRDADCDVDLDDHILAPAAFPLLQAFAEFQNNFTDQLDDGGACCAAPLAAVDDGTGLPPGGVPDIIISEIDPLEHIEIFNTTDADINLQGVSYWFCSPIQYRSLSQSVVVPAHGYAALPWPDQFFSNPTEPNGELILFKTSSFSVSENILDFMCWGSPSTSRKSQAVSVGKWSGSCAASIPPGGAIHRKVGTDGTSAVSYDVTSPPSPMDCP